jgi:hypothetical protein
MKGMAAHTENYRAFIPRIFYSRSYTLKGNLTDSTD